MRSWTKILSAALLALTFLFSTTIFADNTTNIPILCYHNFNPVRPGSMNLTPLKLESQIKWLKENGFTIVPLKDVVAYLQGERTSLPAKSVVITVDDGWESAYKYLYPIARKYNVPVTLFIYPEAISNGKNNLTWNELRELQDSGLFDIQGHTYSHPNFKQEKRHLSPANYENFVTRELVKSKKILEEKLNKQITLLAWPFGIYDDYLEKAAAQAGYKMSFSIDARAANKNFRPMSQPRYMIVDKQSMQHFVGIVNGARTKAKVMHAGNN